MQKNRILIALTLAVLSSASLPAESNQGTVITNLIEKAKKNENWKTAVVTGEQEQIVFMSVSPRTNPTNEIGDETHAFDQAILIVEGQGQCVLNGKASKIKSGDLIFIPKGTLHNVMNSEKDKALKIISFYSATDIPNGSTYQTKADQPQD